MKKAVIPWHVFSETLKNLPQGKRRDEWLQRWRFAEEGAVLEEQTQALEIPSQEASKRQKETVLTQDRTKNQAKILQ